MANGLGAGFAAITLIAVLAGLSILAIFASIGLSVWHRRTGHPPGILRYLCVVIGLVVLGVAGFGTIAFLDEAPPLAGLLASIALVPLLVVGSFFYRSTDLPPPDIVAATVLAWGILFLVGVGVVFGVSTGLTATFDLAPVESRRLGLPWIASVLGGLTIILGMFPLGRRLGTMLSPPPETPPVQ